MNPITYSATAQTVVDAYLALPKSTKSATYWSDPSIAGVKKEIKDHYISEQSHRCAYCCQPIYSNNNAIWDCEHIIPKGKSPEFMFEPRNLAISCKDCNIAKAEQEVRKLVKVAFPDTSADYIIMHPHFDDYDDHIGWIGSICFAKSLDKGARTIAMCNLARYSAMRIGETENIMDTRFNGLVANLFEAKSEQDGEIVLAGIRAFLQTKKTPP